jgi:hypothetical protein
MEGNAREKESSAKYEENLNLLCLEELFDRKSLSVSFIVILAMCMYVCVHQ